MQLQKIKSKMEDLLMAMSKERLVLISTGKINASQKYEQFTEDDLKKMSAATGFVLTPTDDYNAYKTNYSEFITAVAAQAAVLPDGKVFYVGLPVINASDAYVYSSADYDRLKKFIIAIHEKYASDSRFKGFYFTNERVFGTVSVSSPTSNAMVKLMNDLAYVIRNDPNSKIYKEFIWAPYLGYNYTYYKTNQNLGIVANRTNIFNTVYLQSAYYFTPDRGEWNASTRMGIPEKNLELAVKCAQQNNTEINFQE